MEFWRTYIILEIKPCGLGCRIRDVCSLNCKIYGRLEKTNKLELLNCLTYRGLIYIFEVSTKTFRLNSQFSRPRFPKKLKFKTKIWPHFFSEVGGGLFWALKPSLQCHQTFVKVGFHDKVHEGHLPYQKYQLPPILVRFDFFW